MKNDLTFDKPQVVEQLKKIARDRLNESKPPLMPINQPKYQKIVDALNK